MADKPLNVLFIENNDSDTTLVAEAMRALPLLNTLYHVRCIADAIAHIKKSVAVASADSVDAILVSMNICEDDLIAFMKETAGTGHPPHTPTILLTTITKNRSARSYGRIGVTDFVVKSLSFEHFVGALTVTLRKYTAPPPTHPSDNFTF